MAYGDLKVRNLIWNTGSGDNTVVVSTLLSGNSPNWTGTATGVNLTLSGDLQVNGTTTTINTTTLQVEDKNIEIGKVSSPSDTTADGGGWSLLGATTKTFNWVNATDAWTSSEHIHLGDNKKFLAGTGSDLQIFHSGAQSEIINSGGDLLIQCTGDDLNLKAEDDFSLKVTGGVENAIAAIGDGAVELYYDGVKKLETTSIGISTPGYLYLTGDGKEIRMGAGQDFRIYHDGNNSLLDNITGDLLIRQLGSSGDIYLDPKSGERGIKVIRDGSVELYYDNSKKLETGSAGIWVTGNIAAGDNKELQLGENADLKIYHDGTDSFVSNTGPLLVRTLGLGSDLTIRSKHDAFVEVHDGQPGIKAIGGGTVELYHDGVKKIETTTTGITVTGTVSDSKGNLRSIPSNPLSGTHSSHTLVASDAGKVILMSGNLTLTAASQSGPFGGGDAITIINASGSAITLTQGTGLTLYNTADGNTGNRTLAARGMATVYYMYGGNAAYISGAGLS